MCCQYIRILNVLRFFFLMIRRPPCSTRTDNSFPTRRSSDLVDGEAHARGDRPARDARRDSWLAAKGVHVLRYPVHDMLSNLDDVVRQIIQVALDRQS